MLTFLQSLAADGRVRVAGVPPEPPDADELAAAIAAVDDVARADLAGDAPPLSLSTAAWAAAVLEAGCRFLVYRAYDADAVAAALSRPCPDPVDPAAIYSADLFLRHLPDLARMARGLAGDDPLVARLADVGRAWPLSSVGMAGVGTVDPSPFMGHAGLRQLYVDRIIARGDVGRLADPSVRQAVRAALGDFAADLAPNLAAALKEG